MIKFGYLFQLPTSFLLRWNLFIVLGADTQATTDGPRGPGGASRVLGGRWVSCCFMASLLLADIRTLLHFWEESVCRDPQSLWMQCTNIGCHILKDPFVHIVHFVECRCVSVNACLLIEAESTAVFVEQPRLQGWGEQCKEKLFCVHSDVSSIRWWHHNVYLTTCVLYYVRFM